MSVNSLRATVLIVLLGWTVPLAAQDAIVARGAVETSASGGAGFPFGDFKDSANTGYNIGVRAGYYVTDRIAVGGQGVYERYGASDELKQLLSEIVSPGGNVAVDAEFDMLHFTAYGKYLILPSARAVPYVKAHLGLSIIKASGRAGPDEVTCAPPGCASAEEWVSDFAAGGGVGLDVRFGEIFGGFAEASYNAVFTEDSTTQLGSLYAGIVLFVD